jgi:hypothetical protein
MNSLGRAVTFIARKRGPLGAADDLVNLVFVHTQHGLVDGVIVTSEMVTRAKAIGTELRKHLPSIHARFVEKKGNKPDAPTG